MRYRYRTLEAQPVQLQPGAFRLMDVWIDDDGHMQVEPMDESLKAAERIDQLGNTGWRLIHITPNAWYFERAIDDGTALGPGSAQGAASGAAPPSAVLDNLRAHEVKSD